MSDAGTHLNSPAAAGGTPHPPKRRKIRKGTQSCWECKRRKTRCTFAAPTAAVCDGCRSRRTKCVGQEFHDEAPPRASMGDANRLSRVESLLEKMVERNDPGTLEKLGQDPSDAIEGAEPSGGPPFAPVTVPDLDPEMQVISSLEDVSRTLRAAWPHQHDIDLILSIPIGVSVLLHGVVCMPYSTCISKQLSSPQRMLQLPPQGSHPVLVARRLLMLGTFLQGIPPCHSDKLAGMNADYRAIMSRVIKTAARLVTSNDELVDSLDGIECVMIESMYLNNAGNLRRAWMANRRAMVLAQLMGLHTGARSSSKALEADTRERIDPDYMWFRIVSSDRYLSLMLGLPQGSVENLFATPQALESCMDMERMERMISVAGGLILQRNGAERTDRQATHKVDRMLQEAAALMPPQWWSMAPDLTAIASNDAQAFQETIRLMNQFAYYHILVQLHLPYMLLPPSTASNYDYNKMTAATASRAIVTHFVSFRNSILAAAYCRGVDFIAFIASTTLCLAHIESCRQPLPSLQHQRRVDRGLLESTLEIMEKMAQQNQDVIAQEISRILQQLLAIEDNSAKGHSYHASESLDADKDEFQSPGGTIDAHEVALRIEIEIFGTIKIEHRPTRYDILDRPQVPCDELLSSQTTDGSLVVLCDPVSSLNPEHGQGGGRGMASSIRPAGYEISSAEPVNMDWQAIPAYSDSLHPLRRSASANMNASLSSVQTSGEQETHLLVPGLAAGVDEWALQGVDMALFSSLTQGLSESD